MDRHCSLHSIWFPPISHVQHYIRMYQFPKSHCMNKQIVSVSVVCENWRELNGLALFTAFHLVSSNISCPTLHSYVSISQVSLNE